jgi:hypothetical protein
MGQGWVDFLGLCEVFFLIEIPWGRSYPYRLCFSYMSPDNVTQKVHDNNNLNMEGVYEFLLALQVSVRVAGGLLFELLGQSVGDPDNEEEDIPIVLRSWQAQNFLVTAMHVKGPSSNIIVLGVTEVQVLT